MKATRRAYQRQFGKKETPLIYERLGAKQPRENSSTQQNIEKMKAVIEESSKPREEM